MVRFRGQNFWGQISGAEFGVRICGQNLWSDFMGSVEKPAGFWPVFARLVEGLTSQPSMHGHTIEIWYLYLRDNDSLDQLENQRNDVLTVRGVLVVVYVQKVCLVLWI